MELTGWLLVTVAAACAVVFALAAPASAAAAQTKDSFTVAPAPGQPAAANGYFVLTLKPGESTTQQVVVRNDGQNTITVELASIDTSTTPTGGVAYLLVGQGGEGTGSWLTLGEKHVELPPAEQRPVDVVVTVPRDAQPGDYIAGISAMIPIETPTPSASSSGNEASVQVNVQSRRVIAVQVEVPGQAEPKLEISGVTPVPGQKGMGLAIAMSNQGGKFASGNGTIEVPSTSFTQDFSFGLFVPGTSIQYPIDAWQTSPKAGRYPARVLVHYGDNGALTAEWNGDITVAGAAVDELQSQYVPPEGTATPTSRPWLLYGVVGALLVVVVVMGFLLLRRRRPEGGSRG